MTFAAGFPVVQSIQPGLSVPPRSKPQSVNEGRIGAGVEVPNSTSPSRAIQFASGFGSMFEKTKW